MKRKIVMIRKAFGSSKAAEGDGTLFYTGDSSEKANLINEWFLDNPRVLSDSHASLVWMYEPETDRYQMVVVQGSFVVRNDLARRYSFRALYELSRTDMNKIGFNIQHLFNYFPRMSDIKKGKLDKEIEIDVADASPISPQKTIIKNIVGAVLNKKIYVDLDIPGEEYKEDGIFDAKELKKLISAIDSLPIMLRRYVFFAFCVDRNFERLLKDVNVVIYDSKSNLSIPQDAIKTTWEQFVNKDLFPKQDFNTNILLPGDSEPLLSVDDLEIALAAVRKFQVNKHSLKGREWFLWRRLGHKFSDLHTSGWGEFRGFFESMDEKTQNDYADFIKDYILEWNDLDNLNKKVFTYLRLDEKSDRKIILELKRKVMVDYLEKKEKNEDSQYSFLFPDASLDQELKSELNVEFLNSLNFNCEKAKIWYNIYNEYCPNFTKKSPEVKAFNTLFKLKVIPHLRTLSDVIKNMKCYPLITGEQYDELKVKEMVIDKIPLEEDLDDLSDDKKEVIRRVVDNYKRNLFKTIQSFLDKLEDISLHPIDTDSNIVKIIQSYHKDSILELIKNNPNKSKNSEIDFCQRILFFARNMRKKKVWKTYVSQQLLPVVEEYVGNEDAKRITTMYKELQSLKGMSKNKKNGLMRIGLGFIVGVIITCALCLLFHLFPKKTNPENVAKRISPVITLGNVNKWMLNDAYYFKDTIIFVLDNKSKASFCQRCNFTPDDSVLINFTLDDSVPIITLSEVTDWIRNDSVAKIEGNDTVLTLDETALEKLMGRSVKISADSLTSLYQIIKKKK